MPFPSRVILSLHLHEKHFFYHIPGLKLVTPSTPYDAKGLLIQAIRDDNPVMFFVHKHTYGSKGRPLLKSRISTGNVPEEIYTIDFGVADVKKTGTDVTIVSILRMVHRSVNAAEKLEEEGLSVEVIDLRTLFPLVPLLQHKQFFDPCSQALITPRLCHCFSILIFSKRS